MGAAEIEAVDFRGIVESQRGDVGVTWPRKTAMVLTRPYNRVSAGCAGVTRQSRVRILLFK